MCTHTHKQANTHRKRTRWREEKLINKHFRVFSLSAVFAPLGRQNSVRLGFPKLHAKTKLGLETSSLGSCHFYTQEVSVLGPAFVYVAQFMCFIAFFLGCFSWVSVGVVATAPGRRHSMRELSDNQQFLLTWWLGTLRELTHQNRYGTSKANLAWFWFLIFDFRKGLM